MIYVDGSAGEGGGQILRTSLALSLITQQPFRIRGIRAGRRKPGLLRQHLTAARAAAEIGGATLEGDAVGSTELTFRPTCVRAGAYTFSVGTAGSAGLVMQSVLPALLCADGPSELEISGGTHNMASPPFEFLERVYLPWVRRAGPLVEATLHRRGFYPAGGGRFSLTVQPSPSLARLDVLERGALLGVSAEAVVSRLPGAVAVDELAGAREALGLAESQTRITQVSDAISPGNVLFIEVRSEHITELVTGFGQRGVSAAAVAERACAEAKAYLAGGAPVGRHLADQLLLLMAVAGGGSFRTARPTLHTRTNIDTIQRFLDLRIEVHEEGDGVVRVELG